MGEPQKNVPEEYETLQEALEAYGISEDIVPGQVPEGFELVRLKVPDAPDVGESEFSAYYENAGSPLTIFVVYPSGSHANEPYKYEKDDSPVEEYASNGITYYQEVIIHRSLTTWLRQTKNRN